MLPVGRGEDQNSLSHRAGIGKAGFRTQMDERLERTNSAMRRPTGGCHEVRRLTLGIVGYGKIVGIHQSLLLLSVFRLAARGQFGHIERVLLWGSLNIAIPRCEHAAQSIWSVPIQ